MIKVFRCYKYKQMTVYINGIVESEKSGKRLVLWRDIRAKEGTPFKATLEEEFEIEAVIVQ